MADPENAGRGSRAAVVLAWVAGALLVLAGLALSEGWIIALAVALGPVWAFVVVWAVCSAGACLIAFAFDESEARRGMLPLVRRVREWIARRRETVEKRTAALLEFGALVAFVVLSVTVGPFLTAIAVKLRGGDPRTGYALCVISSALFSAVWVSVYSGGIAVVRKVFAG